MPNVFNETARIDSVLAHEQDREFSREAVTLLTGTAYLAGAVLGLIALATDPVEAADGGNTGDGTISAAALGADTKAGIYTLTCIAAATDGGRFQVVDPDGDALEDALVGVAYANSHLGFTISDGATDFAVGDSFTVTVAAAASAGKYKLSPETGLDGAEVAVAVLLADVDATAGDATGVIVARGAVVKAGGLNYDATVDDAAKKAVKQAELLAAGIVTRESV